ncbi:MAG: RHS repeat-associated core domain-containing protein [Francisellaceae bacterium]
MILINLKVLEMPCNPISQQRLLILIFGLLTAISAFAQETERYFYSNAKSIVMVADKANNPNTYSYRAYGQRQGDPSTVKPNTDRFGYNGEYRDGLTGFVYLRARSYDPDKKRFLTRDSEINQWNRYNFAAANPVINIDPSGHSAWNWIGLGAGIAAAVATTVTSSNAAILFFALGGASASVVQSAGDFKHHQYYAAAGNLVNAAGALFGLVSAQPEMFSFVPATTEISALRETDEAMAMAQKALRNRYILISSTASNVATGAGAGLKEYQQDYGNSHNAAKIAQYVLISSLFGFAGGYAYGKMSSGINGETPYLKAAFLGSRRTFTNGLISSLGGISNRLINDSQTHDYSNLRSGSYWQNEAVNLSSSLALGAVSGIGQAGLARDTNSFSFRLYRFGYLNIKAPVFSSLISGHIKDYSNLGW